MRKAFGSTTTLRIRVWPRAWVVKVLTDSARHPQDGEDFRALSRSFTAFFRQGFGAQTDVVVKARLMAGARGDGRPPDQLVLLPSLPLPRRQSAPGVH